MTDLPATSNPASPSPEGTANHDIGFERLMLSRRAATTEARNRPLWMSAIAIAAVLIALIYVFNGASSVATAKTVRDAQLVTAQRLQSLVGAREQLLMQLDGLESGGGPTTGSPRGTTPVSIIQQAAVDAGLAAPAIPRERIERVGGQSNLTKKTYPYNRIRATDPADLLEWVVLVLDRSPTMDIDSIRLSNTEISGWTMDIEFTRVEDTP